MSIFNSSTISAYLIKLSAYESLIDSRITELPVDLINIFKKRDDVSLYSFTFFEKVDGWDLLTCKRAFGEYGAIAYSCDMKKYFAYYNDHHSEDLVRWELANLLACLELGIASTESSTKVSCSEGDCTDTFAYYFTAPDVILVESKQSTAADIISACCIPFDKANRKAKKLKLHWAEKKIYIEEILKRNFKEYISNMRFSE